jgi:succinoglycan biosynthesis protein ExoA
LQGVLIVIPTLNEAAHIRSCITSLLADAPGATCVVCDGGSTDATRRIVSDMIPAFPGLQLMHNPARLQSAGITSAVAEFGAEIHRVLVRCDAHAAYPPGFVTNVVDSLSRNKAAALVVPMDAVGTTGFSRAAAWIVDTPLGSGGAAHRGGRRSGPVDHGHHAGMDIAWFRRIGGYDPDFSHNEDAEFDHRLAQAGGRIWLDADLRLSYVMRPTWSGLARQYWNYGKGRARTIAKHRMRPRLRQMIPVVNLVGMVLSLVIATAWPPALAWPLSYVLALAIVAVVCAARLGAVSGLWAGPALAAMHNAWAAGFLFQCGRSLWRS